VLSISNLTKRFGDLCVMEDFALEVPQNGFTVLIGPSGCGKSTLFDLLMGVVAEDQGQISWQGKELPHLGQWAAYMQQKDLLLPWFTLLDNALLPAKIARSDATASQRRAQSFFDRLGLSGFEHYHPREVSGGMRQRCALVRTLMFDHELVLLDEPLSALDAITRQDLQSLLLLLQAEFSKSILMITHDVEEALHLADELVVLSPAPMRIRESYVLADPKPRPMNDPKLLELKAHILSKLQTGVNDATL